MGLDVGDKRIGVALSDSGGILASPFTIIECSNEQNDITAIIDIITANEVGRVVAGLPRSMNGSIGPQAEKVQLFVNSLALRVNVPVELRDERLTTVAARRIMQVSRPRKSQRQGKQGRDDAIAAALILQGYLDERHLADERNSQL